MRYGIFDINGDQVGVVDQADGEDVTATLDSFREDGYYARPLPENKLVVYDPDPFLEDCDEDVGGAHRWVLIDTERGVVLGRYLEERYAKMGLRADFNVPLTEEEKEQAHLGADVEQEQQLDQGSEFND
jgi:hypothetical protein